MNHREAAAEDQAERAVLRVFVFVSHRVLARNLAGSFTARLLECRRRPNAFAHPAHTHRRRPRRPPLRLVLSDGVGVTSSILPIFIPERAKARRAD